MEKLFFFDLETTGLYHWRHGIHQIAGMIVIDGEVKDEFNFNVKPNPKATIEKEALAVAGVTLNRVMAYPDMKEVHAQLLKVLAKHVDKFKKTDKFHLVGFNNAGFDNAFFRAFFKQNGDEYFGSWFWSDTIDVMSLASFHLREQRAKLENFKLATVAEYLGVKVDKEKLHDAMYDIYLTKAIFDIIQ